MGVRALSLSHNQGMENQNVENGAFTKDIQSADCGVLLTQKDAVEFRAYKRRRRMTEVALAISRSESVATSGEDLRLVCDRATRLKQAAVQTTLSMLLSVKAHLAGTTVGIDCVVGGIGETWAKVKAYEARLAVQKGAKEITLPITPSLFNVCRYNEICKEVRKVKRAIGKKAVLKIRVEKTSSPTALSRLARIASEGGAKYLSVPYFSGVERLCLDLTNGCLLETTGVETVADYKHLFAKGVGRIVTDKAWEIYNDWMREAYETPLISEEKKPSDTSPLQTSVATAKLSSLTEKGVQKDKKAEQDALVLL